MKQLKDNAHMNYIHYLSMKAIENDSVQLIETYSAENYLLIIGSYW